MYGISAVRNELLKTYKYYTSTERNIWFFHVPALVYLFLLLFHALWDYLPDSWNDVYSQQSFPNVPHPVEEYSTGNLTEDVTIVTAYFHLGKFLKGTHSVFTPDTYKQWMSAYSNLNNTVIAYTDSPEIALFFKSVRLQRFSPQMTQVYLVRREDYWAFKLAPRIKKIYSQPGYPKYAPNTINEYYSCAMHVKYDLVKNVIHNKLHKTRYVAWVDIGYFRETITKPFKLLPPSNLKEGYIAYTQIYPFLELDPGDIVRGNHVWIAGGFFIGKPEYLMTMIEDYKMAVEHLLSHNLMSTDQQILYTMYTPKSGLRPRVPVQTLYHLCRCDWFYIGELCRETYEKKLRPNHPVINFYSHLM